jgi:hypothetical protein
MRVIGLGWLATRTPAFDQMVSFARDQLHLVPSKLTSDTASFTLPSGDTFEVYGSEEAGGGHPADGAVGAFLVDDAEAAHGELARSGAEVLELHVDGEFRWFYVKAPDGSYYELYSTRS